MLKKLFNSIFNTKSDPIPFGQGLDLTGLPIVTFKQGEKKFNFILDTGSTHNVIQPSVLSEIEHTMTNVGSDIYGIDGDKRAAQYCVISVSYKNTNYEDAFIVYDLSTALGNLKQESGVIVHGILGSGFFKKFQYILDFEELVAYSKK